MIYNASFKKLQNMPERYQDERNYVTSVFVSDLADAPWVDKWKCNIRQIDG